MRLVNKNYKGFTLIELLVVITIIATLAVVVFVALNPAGRLAQARDARRTSDVDSLLTAIHQYIVDNKGSIPTGLTATEKELGTCATVGTTAITSGGCNVPANSACVDLSSQLATYLKSIPTDPKNGTASLTDYDVNVDANGIVTVRACGTEGTSDISSSR